MPVRSSYASSSLRATRRREIDRQAQEERCRALLLSSLVTISAVPTWAFAEDQRKEASSLIREITARIRRLREIAPK